MTNSAFFRCFFGAVVWLAVVAWRHPALHAVGWDVALLLLAPLVLVPAGLALVDRSRGGPAAASLLFLADYLQLPAALLLVVAFALPVGPAATFLALPWCLVTIVLSIAGLVRLVQRRFRPIEEACIDCGLVFLVIGGVGAVWDRYGARPLAFEPVIILLTAIHFHYAGFVLPLATGLAANRLPGPAARAVCVGVVAGIPLVAVGINATQLGFGPALECFAATWLSVAALGTAGLHVQLAASGDRPRAPATPHPSPPPHGGREWLMRALWAVCGAALAFSMVLAALYGWRFYLPLSWLEIPWMRAVHGTANALLFSAVAIVAAGIAQSGARVARPERAWSIGAAGAGSPSVKVPAL
ncbi:MAG: YndJ family transporter [Planctomycetia bacterium]|nr:YndJ family transporter [Planctomycetia bacterium]